MLKKIIAQAIVSTTKTASVDPRKEIFGRPQPKKESK